MLTLDATTKSFEIVLAGAVAANQLPVTVSYTDITTTTCLGGCSDTATNSTTPVTVVAAPGASTQRHVDTLTVYNADTASVTFTISLNNNATLRTILKITLLTLENFLYERGKGWVVYDVNGNVKHAVAINVSDTAFAASWDGVTTIAPSKNAVYDQVILKANLINPAFTTPDLGTPSACVLTNCTGLPQAGVVGLTVTSGPTFDHIHLTSGQVGFPATAVLSADPNTLDDYEEGYHPVTVTCSTSGSYTVGISTQFAYTKIGRVVHVIGQVEITGATSPVGDIRVSLPFTCATLTHTAELAAGSVILYNHGGTIPNGIHVRLTDAAAYFEFINVADNGLAVILNQGNVDTAWNLGVDLTYIAV